MLIGTDVENLNETKNFLIGDIANFILADNYVPYVGADKDVDLGLFSITASSFIVPGGLPTQFVKADGTLDSTVYQPAGNYITGLSGEAAASGPGVATVVLNNGAVIGKVLTGLTITGGSVSSTDTILQAFGKLQNQVNSLYGGAIYQGTWNASANTPTLQSGVGTKGYYYIVNVAGSTNLDGITDWNVGDWAIFDGTAWQQVDNTDTVVSVNGKVGVVVLTTTDIAEGDNLYYTDERVWIALSLTTTGNSGAATYNNESGEFNIPDYSLSGLGGVPSTRELTINGTTYDLSADRSWDVGTVTSIGTSGPLTGGTITDSGTIGITQSGVSSDGYLSSADWNTFNDKQDALTNPVTGTGTTYYLPMWTGATTLADSIISIGLGVVNFNYNNAEGATVNYINTATTTYTYSISMNNVTRATFHSYTDGIVVNSIGANQVSRVFANGNMILGDGTSDTGYKLSIEGNLYIETIINATTDTDKFIVSDSGVIKYRTGSEVLSDIGAVPATRQLTINGTSYDLSADRSWSVGTVTSVDMSVPTGFAISGNPVTGSGTLAVAFASGYSLPTNASQDTWDTAYDRSLTSAAVTGTVTKTLTLNQQDGGTITASWTDYDTAPVTSVFGRTGAVIAQSGDYSTTLVTEGTNLYFTDSRARSAISLTTTGSSGPATYSNVTGILNIPNYGSALTGYVPYTGATGNVNLGEFGITAGYVGFDLTPTGTPTTQGTMYWDDSHSTVALIMNGTIQHIGQDTYFYVKNSTGSPIPKGTAVMFAGTDGASGHILIAPFLANGAFPSSNFMGVTSEAIANGSFGQVTHFGEIEGFNTSGYSAGSLLYASTTVPGGFQTTAPSAPNNIVLVAAALNSKNNGTITVRPTYGSNINDDEGVLITSPANNQGLFYDSTSTLWVNKTIAAALGYTPVPTTRQLTINGTSYDLSADRSWSVGTVTSITAGAGLDGGTITTTGTISHGDTSSQASVDNTGGFVIQDVTLDTYGHVTGLASTDFDLRYVPLTRTLNGLALSSNQTFATGTTGTDFNIVSSGTVHTFNIPDASASARGFINATTQTIGGAKTFTASPTAPAYYLTSMGAGSGALYYNTLESRLTLANYNAGGKLMFEVNGGNYTVSFNADLSVQLLGYTTNGILRTSGSNGTLIVDTTAYTPQSRTLTINGTAYDLSADRSWSVGTVTSVGLSVPTGFSIGSSPVTGSGTLALTFASGYSLPTNAKQANWDTAYENRITSLTTTGTSGAATLVSNVLNIPIYQAQGNYITSLTGEATASGPGAASVTLSNSAVTGKVLTGLTVTGTTISSTDSILTALGKLQGQVNDLIGGLQYQGTWNASTNSPTITSGVGTDGYFYIVSVAGNTTIDGVSGWQIGDWIVFHGSAWQKVDNTESVTSVNGFTGAVNLTTSNISEGTNLYFTDSRARSAISLTTTGNSGASTYSNVTGILNVPQYSLAGLGGVPTTRTLTINGTALDLSADRSWSVGTVTSIATSGPITGGTITGSGTIGITQSGTSSNGFLSSTDWNTFNNKQATISLTTTGNSGASTFLSNVLNIPNYTLGGLGGVPETRTITINGTSFDLSANRTWSVGTVTSITFSGPLTGGTITGSGTVGILQASGSQGGFLSSTDWTTFNNKQNAISVTAPITLVGSTIAITQSGASSNGFLSSTDWNTFNGKQNAITLTTTGTSGAATLVGATLNIPIYQSVLTNPITGTGTTNYLAKFTGTSAIGNSLLFDSGSAVGLGTATINAAALFQMDSTTRGFLPPRMTQAQRQAISTTPEGLIVYQTNGVIGLYIYANGTWRTLGMI
jgi:predicted heme/steroid binding protein